MGLMEILGHILHHLGTHGAGALGLKIAQHLRPLFEDVSNSVRLRGFYPSPPIRADVAAAPPPLPGLMGKVRWDRRPEGTSRQGRKVPGGFRAASEVPFPNLVPSSPRGRGRDGGWGLRDAGRQFGLRKTLGSSHGGHQWPAWGQVNDSRSSE